MIKYIKYATFIYFLLIVKSFNAQAITNISNNAFINISNSAYYVIDNDNANALITSGTGGNIISEGENNLLKWNISTATGVLTIPWTTNSKVKIPLTINKTSAGAGLGNLLLSTYETTDLNTPLPAGVTNLNSVSGGPLFVVDRFWHIAATNYTTKPDVTLTINYNSAANEIGGTNTITPSNLLAQRFNTVINQWEASKLFGVNDALNNRVISIVVPSSDFFNDWTLVDAIAPLPVKLLEFKVLCERSGSLIKWTTASEINNDYFIIQKSTDAINYLDIKTIKGAGNSNNLQSYAVTYQPSSNENNYYRLKQVDFDGNSEVFNPVSKTCISNNINVDAVFLSSNKANIVVNSSANKLLVFRLFNSSGKLIFQKDKNITVGINNIDISGFSIASGIYMLSIVGENFQYSKKVISFSNQW